MDPALAPGKGRSAGRLPVINSLRGMAIGGVLFNHVLAGMLTPPALELPIFGAKVSISPLLTNGWTGVNLFFILSDFVLFLPYIMRSMGGGCMTFATA